MATRAPAIIAFKNIRRAMNPAGDREVGLDVPEDDRRPMQPQQQFLGAAQVQTRGHFEQFEIEIGLIETVEQHQRIRARGVEAFRDVRRRAEKRRQLHRDGNSYTLFYLAHQLEVGALDVGRAAAPGQ